MTGSLEVIVTRQTDQNYRLETISEQEANLSAQQTNLSVQQTELIGNQSDLMTRLEDMNRRLDDLDRSAAVRTTQAKGPVWLSLIQ